MLVKDWMSKNLVTVKPTDSVVKAQTLLLGRNSSRLPVMEEEKLLGIITERDIRKLLIPSETLRVKNLMTRCPVPLLSIRERQNPATSGAILRPLFVSPVFR